MDNIHELINLASKDHSGSIYLFDKNCIVKYREIPSIIHNISQLLHGLNINKGDMVGIYMPKSSILCMVYLACFYHGCIACPISFDQTFDPLNHIDMPLKTIITIKDVPRNHINILSQNILRFSVHKLPAGCMDNNATVYLNLTSGTTNKPKLARCTFDAIYHNTQSTVKKFNFSQKDIHLCMFPAHIHPHEFFMRPLLTGGKAMIIDNILAREIPDVLAANRITALMATPTIQKTMITYSRSGKEAYKFTRLFEAGGMITPPSLRKEFMEITGKNITPVWGSTETLGVALCLGPGQPYFNNLLGSPIDGYHACIEDNKTEGTMLIKSKGLMKGYYNNADIGDTFRTGDIVHRKGTNFYFKGRIDNMIKKGGLRIYPEELTNKIRSMESVKDAAILPFEHDLYGRDIALFVELSRPISLKDLKKELIDILEPHEVPHKIKVSDHIPYLPSGKLDYPCLKMMLKAF